MPCWCSGRRSSTSRSGASPESGGSLDFGEGVGSLGIQRADVYEPPVWPPEPGRPGMQLHLEVEVSDLAAAVAHAVELGATVADSSHRTTCGSCSTPPATRSASTPDRRSGPSPAPRRDSPSSPPRRFPTWTAENSHFGVTQPASSRSRFLRAADSQCSRPYAVWNSCPRPARSRSTAARPRGEVGVGEVGVLAADAGDVRVVPLARRRQDPQVGVAERLPGEIVGGRVVGLGEPDQPGHLVGVRRTGQGLLGPDRAALLGVALPVVDRVVEPRGQTGGPGRSRPPPT